MSYLMIFITGIFVNNIILSQFLGICPFLGVSKKISTALGMGMAVTFVMTLSTVVTFLLYYTFLQPLGLQFMTTVAFILVIASLVQMVEIILKKSSPALYQALGIFLPLITTNCAVLGIAILTIQKNFSLIAGICYCLAAALGFTLAIVIFAGIRERLERTPIPKLMQGTPIVLITAALLSMAFMGFAGISY
ncbi:MAG: electron transport complex subunit RsxA [Alphaproteobacteria bacterium]|nr:electron transport complex subunit RsxA [Alphaproteobacteria bacterium]MBQ9235477.1 electron transport complex subunit RsxA [Alphaproteobacteria bacterium]